MGTCEKSSESEYMHYNQMYLLDEHTISVFNDTLAEWLRRRPAKPMGSPCVGSNPTGVDSVVE